MVNGISTQGQLLLNLNRINASQRNVDEQSSRISSGRKQRYLRDYQEDASRLVELRHEITQRESYIRTTELTVSTVRAYDQAFESFATLADEILSTTNPDPSIEPAQLRVLAQDFKLEIESSLNIEVAGRYIFNGLQFENAPADLSSLSLVPLNSANIDRLDTIEEEPIIPRYEIVDPTTGAVTSNISYHTSFSATAPNQANVDAYSQFRITIDQSQTIEYGSTATDPAFQRLVQAVVRLESSTQEGITETQRATLVQQARSLALEARDGIRQLQTRNGIVNNILDSAKTRHDNFNSLLRISLANIQEVDSAQAAVELSSLTTQLQASFSTVATISQLSLINFLR